MWIVVLSFLLGQAAGNPVGKGWGEFVRLAEAQNPAQEPASSAEFCMAFTGDLMHHCTQGTGARLNAGGKGFNYNPPFDVIKRFLEDAPIAVGNLETPIDGIQKDHCFPRFSAPEEYLDATAAAGFDILSVANNHSMDRGVDGLRKTMKLIRDKGMLPAGTEDTSVVTVEKGRLKIAVVAATDYLNWRCPTPPCPIMVREASQWNDLFARVEKAAGEHDITVVFIHWMFEKQTKSSKKDRRLARNLIYAGATAVIGHHTHTLANAEFLYAPLKPGTVKDPAFEAPVDSKPASGTQQRKAYVRYSLGNLISAMKGFPTKMAGVERVCFAKGQTGVFEVSKVEFIPTWTRRNAGKKWPKAFQAVPILEIAKQCEDRTGPYPNVSGAECGEIKEYTTFLKKRPDLFPAE